MENQRNCCPPPPLSEFDLKEYKQLIVDLLNCISDEIIQSQRQLSREQKLSVLALKYGLTTQEVRSSLTILRDVVYWQPPNHDKPSFLWSASAETGLSISFIDAKPNSVAIEGHLNTCFPITDVSLHLETEDGLAVSDLFLRDDTIESNFFENDCFYRIGFTAHLPVGVTEFFLNVKNKILPIKISRTKICPLVNRRYAYYWHAGMSTTISGNRKIIYAKRTKAWLVKREMRYELNLLLSKQATLSDLRLRRHGVRKHVFPFNRKIWLISDRANLAGDNGEALFEYLQNKLPDNTKVYFVLEKDSPDYQRLKEIGPVVPYWSKRHKQLLLRSKANISSIADEFVTNPFEDRRWLYTDLLDTNYIFLQHGITQNDLSNWLKRWNKNIKLFATAAKPERDSILDNPRYGYTKDVVKLTGFTRHDKLLRTNNLNEKIILIAPTWRRWLVGNRKANSGAFESSSFFINSEYYQLYQALINDSDLNEVASEYGFRLRFLPHPALINEVGSFTSNQAEVVTEYNYAEELARAAIMVTDYSSVAFDFALLKKPIVYFQFDEERFFENQWTHGYYDFYRDGFGPVCKTYSELKGTLIQTIQRPFMNREYKERVDLFFGELDGLACKRTVDLIEEIAK